ncbi:Hpt domain-containing protein [Pseudomonas sp. YuFO20]|uniref:Hpt domain-containing protein n=1 Tax=unclassified Pseudomonas TaxID=196821 RepID=UPI002B247AB4|nr:Hpt domain-containing protein [Pseudomonas sp. YuFO20]MEB2519761.1 Hpt domain-containing protein [Pseudomonas sp. YuFO20]
MTDEHLDLDALSALREVMEDEYPKLLDTFLSDSEERLGLLRKAQQGAQLIEEAHSFKGSSLNMGAVRLAELCGQLEKSANSLSSLDISELIAKIDGEFAFVRPLYQAERQRSLAEN